MGLCQCSADSHGEVDAPKTGRVGAVYTTMTLDLTYTNTYTTSSTSTHSLSFSSFLPFFLPSTYPPHLASLLSASRICFFSLSSLECSCLAYFSNIPPLFLSSMLHLSFSVFTYPAQFMQEASITMQCIPTLPALGFTRGACPLIIQV